MNKVSIHFGPDKTDDHFKHQNKLFKNNTISTTKYNILTWFPKSLLMQFKRIANLYFLLITLLTLMPFSPKNPIAQVFTFVIVLIFTMIKEAYEDWKRYKQDNEINNKLTYIYDYNTREFKRRKWHEILVGDLVKVRIYYIII